MKKLLIAIAAVLLMVVIAKAQIATTVVVVTPEQASALRVAYEDYDCARIQFEALRAKVVLENERELFEATKGETDKYSWQYSHRFKAIVGYRTGPDPIYFEEKSGDKAEEVFLVPEFIKKEKPKPPIKVPEKMVARKR